MLKKIFMVLAVMLLSTAFVACTGNTDTQHNEVKRGRRIICDDDCFYFVENETRHMVQLSQYKDNARTKVIEGEEFSDLFLIDGKLYFAVTDNYELTTVYSFDGNTLTKKGELEGSQGYYLSIISYDDALLVLCENNVYKQSGEEFVLAEEGVTSIAIDNGDVYYSDSNGNILRYAGKDSEVLVSREELVKEKYIQGSLGGENATYVINNLTVHNGDLYFIINDANLSYGWIYKLDMETGQAARADEGVTHDFEFSNDELYYYDMNCEQLVTSDENGQHTVENTEGIANVYYMDNNTIFCQKNVAKIGSYDYKYYQIKNGEASELQLQ